MRKYGWQIAPADEAAEPAQGASAGPPRATSTRKQRLLKELPVDQIVRPLGRTRANGGAHGCPLVRARGLLAQARGPNTCTRYCA